MSARLQNRTALVTGATSGMALAARGRGAIAADLGAGGPAITELARRTFGRLKLANGLAGTSRPLARH
jgi:NAD(P)-dependent dehydrogenase (short-subunit alcohol dehydrogenase family)